MLNKPKWLTRKTAANRQVQIPEQKPSRGRKKQGPFFRKRVIVKDATRYNLFSDFRHSRFFEVQVQEDTEGGQGFHVGLKAVHLDNILVQGAIC